MKIRSALLAFAVAAVLASTQGLAQNAYVTNGPLSSVQVIDTKNNEVVAAIAAGNFGRSGEPGR
jgi:YVTN family beta-propeller protein